MPFEGPVLTLITVRKGYWTWGDDTIVAQTLATAERKILQKDAADARYLPTGHLLFLRRGALLAVPFDGGRLEVSGKQIPVQEQVAQALVSLSTADITGAGQFAVASTGTLA